MPPNRAGRAGTPSPKPLTEALTDPACYDHEVSRVRVAETHISWVFLTGRYAYKVKKPVKLPFLDFSTLKARRHYCEEEIRLNRRLAPDLYLGVVPIGGSPEAPRVGQKPAHEYAVKMLEFESEARLDRCLARGAVPVSAVGEFAARLAAFHRKLARLRRDPSGAAVSAAALDNFAALEQDPPTSLRATLAKLHAWTESEAAALATTFARRVQAGVQRECHGDLHLENLLWQDGRIVAYDALEFDPRLREIDVISEAAFLAMDFMAHGHDDLGYAFLNRYLEVSGDYDGLHVLRFYLVYRALIRAKVGMIKQQQRAAVRHEHPYIDTASRLAAPRRPMLLITHGLSGSGKTSISDELVWRLPALRVRSDLERKRLHGLSADARTHSAVGQGLYGAAADQATYGALARCADTALRHRFDFIVDATFLSRAERWSFHQIAAANAARFVILDCTASLAELRRRIRKRAEGGRDASEANLAVLERQLQAADPLDRAERRSVVRIDTERPIPYARLLATLATR